MTPSKHLRLPTIEDVHEGVSWRYALLPTLPTLLKVFPEQLKKTMQWPLIVKILTEKDQYSIFLDPEKARRWRDESGVDESHGACTMCGSLCAYKVIKRGVKKAI